MFSAKKIFFKNAKNQKLCGILYTQKGKNKNAVIMTHGLSGDKDENGLFIRTASALAKKGHSVLRFDCAGSGESDGNSVKITRRSEARDLKTAIKFMKKRTHFRNLCLIGLSLGASVSTLAYSKEVKTMILYSPAILYSLGQRYSKDKNAMRELKEKGYISRPRSWGFFRIGKKLFYEDASINFKKRAGKVNAPVLLIHGSKDSVITLKYAKGTQKIFRNAKLIVLKNADHNFTNPKHEKQLINLTINWLERHMK